MTSTNDSAAVRFIKVDDLRPQQNPTRPIYHVSGAKIHEAREPLPQTRIDLMRECGIRQLAVLQEGGTLEDLKRIVYFDTIALEHLGNGTMVLVKDIFDNRGHVIVRKGVKMTKPLIESIRRKNQELFVEKSDIDDEREALKKFRAACETMGEVGLKFNKPLLTLEDLPLMPPGERIDEESLDLRISQGFEEVSPNGPPLSRLFKNRDALRPRPQSEIDTYSSLRVASLRSLDSVFSQVVNNSGFSHQYILDLSTQIINALLHDRDLLMNLVNVHSGDDYLKRHSINTCILSIQMATALGYDDCQVMEVAFGALFADIGMFRVPENIRYKTSALTPDEWYEVRKHPIYSINLLSRIPKMPKLAGLVAYQSHERLDGSGYPKGRQGTMIHDYARIVAIADVYDALVSTREWRSGAAPYKAMEELLLQCRAKKLDGRILRAFLMTVGLFPVGSWVSLSDGRVGQVTGLGEDGVYDRPAVTILFNGQTSLPRAQRVLLTEREDLKITNFVDPEKLNITDSYAGFGNG